MRLGQIYQVIETMPSISLRPKFEKRVSSFNPCEICERGRAYKFPNVLDVCCGGAGAHQHLADDGYGRDSVLADAQRQQLHASTGQIVIKVRTVRLQPHM